jgi:TatA/E family protein of Tat protein translocase
MLTPVLLFFDISAGELMVILLVAFIVFGPSKIPEVARKIGRGISEVRRASDEIKREISKETRKMDSSFSMDDFDLTGTKRPVKKNEDSRTTDNEIKTGPQKQDDQTGDDSAPMV